MHWSTTKFFSHIEMITSTGWLIILIILVCLVVGLVAFNWALKGTSQLPRCACSACEPRCSNIVNYDEIVCGPCESDSHIVRLETKEERVP